MAKKRTTTIVKEIEEQVEPKDQPAVMAYRLGSLEKAVKDGFEEMKKRQDDMIRGFVTEKEFIDAKTEAKEEHTQLWAEINRFKSSVKWWVGTSIGILGVIATAAGLIH